MTKVNNLNRLKDTRKDLRNNSTYSEKIMWDILKGSKFLGLKFRRQHSINRYILDFYCPELKIGIEIDGKIHEGREEYDEIRTDFLHSYGICIIRIKNEEINENIELVMKEIEKQIKFNSPHPNPPPNKGREQNKKVPLPTREGLGEGGNYSLHDTIDKIGYKNIARPGIDENLIRQISLSNNEPDWMLEIRLKALKEFLAKPMPSYGPDLSGLDLQSIYYFAKPEGAGDNKTWDDVPENIKNTFDKLGIPEAEKSYLAGVGAQYDSETVYHSLDQELIDLGVIFDDMSHALQKYPEIVKKYFSRAIPISDHKFASLHYAVWSGGTFMYVPKGVKIEKPLQSYFRMNLKSGGQFEHTIIILEDEREAHYIEGCSAPKYGTSSLHAGGVEIFVGVGAKMRYSSVENWSIDTYNLNTKRAILEKDAFIEWVGGNMGSGVTMLYPCSILKGDGSKASHLGVAMARAGQNQDVGSKVIHIGKNTSSEIISKSISKGGGISTYRGLVDIKPSATGSISKVECDGLILDDISISDAIPVISVGNADSTIVHEASAGRINEDFLFYLQSRGIDEKQASTLIVNGFVSPILKELPLEYASEMNVLIGMEIEGV